MYYKLYYKVQSSCPYFVQYQYCSAGAQSDASVGLDDTVERVELEPQFRWNGRCPRWGQQVVRLYIMQALCIYVPNVDIFIMIRLSFMPRRIKNSSGSSTHVCGTMLFVKTREVSIPFLVQLLGDFRGAPAKSVIAK